jgi:hypothetical protein
MVGSVRRRRFYGGTINTFLNRNSTATNVQILVDYVQVQFDDINPTNPARYSFDLNGNPWNLGFGGAGGNQLLATGIRNIPTTGANVNATDGISATGRWRDNAGIVDGCRGFKIRLSVTITRKLRRQ